MQSAGIVIGFWTDLGKIDLTRVETAAMTAKEAIAAVLIILGLLFLLRPVENWAVVGDMGSPMFPLVGAVFLVVGILALRAWKE